MPLQRRLPKRGFTSLTRGRTAEVRLADLQSDEGDDIDLAALKAAGVVPQRRARGQGDPVRRAQAQGQRCKGVRVTQGRARRDRSGRRQRSSSPIEEKPAGAEARRRSEAGAD